MKLFLAKIFELATFAKSTTSDRNSALLPANVDLRPPYSEVFAAIENCEIARWLNVHEPIHSLQSFEFFKDKFFEATRYYELKLSQLTEIVNMFFQYSEGLF